MKKLLSLILCLMLCLPALALAEDITEAPELYTVDFGAFTVDFAPNDYYEVADEMVSNQLYAIIYPNYDPNGVTYDNINVVWSKENAVNEVLAYGAETYANLVMQSAQAQFDAMGIKMLNGQVLSAIVEDGSYASVSYMELDYTGAGVDLVTPQYQMQTFYVTEAGETFMFTLTAITMDNLQELINYLDRINFK